MLKPNKDPLQEADDESSIGETVTSCDALPAGIVTLPRSC